MTTSTESLERKIESVVEQLVREHLAACEAAATKAVREAFRRASASPSMPRRRETSTRSQSPSGRRSREEVAELAERLYEAICAHPGETMLVLAPAAGVAPRELSHPARLLLGSERVRCVGQRQQTRYFPMEE